MAPKKPKLTDALETRNVPVQPEPVITKNVMQEIAASLAPTDTQTRIEVSEQAEVPVDTHASMHAPMQERKKVEKHATTRIRKQGDTNNVDALSDQLKNKKHLSTSSYRYQSGELTEMDDIFKELDGVKPGRMSKNDMVRLALILLCQDYRENGDESILKKVQNRM